MGRFFIPRSRIRPKTDTQPRPQGFFLKKWVGREKATCRRPVIVPGWKADLHPARTRFVCFMIGLWRILFTVGNVEISVDIAVDIAVDTPSIVDRYSADSLSHYRPTIDRLSTDHRPTIDRLSTDCRPTIDRLSTDYRPTMDRLSTDYRPTVDRYIDRYVDRYLSRHYLQ